MPEYLSPGVYVEETSFRSKTIEGVPTSTTGFVGVTRWGPVKYSGGPTATEPRLITSFTEFERVYGGLQQMFDKSREAYTAHAARAFFANGGKRLYVSRVFVPNDDNNDFGIAKADVAVGQATVTVAARWPGQIGNDLRVVIKPTRTVAAVVGGKVPGHSGPLVIESPKAAKPTDDISPTAFDPAAPGADRPINVLQLTVEVTVPDQPLTAITGLSPVPGSQRSIFNLLGNEPDDEDTPVRVTLSDPQNQADPVAIFTALAGLKVAGRQHVLLAGNDGQLPTADALKGKEADLDDPKGAATGLEALGDIDDIAIVACPDAGALDDDTAVNATVQYLLRHCEDLKYRIAVIDAPQASSMNEVRNFRAQFDSKYGALYHPWIEILDPLSRPAQGFPQRRILLPPSGFVTGIYARNDVERGVYKAPANEVIVGLTRFEMNINKGRQDVLNPEGINALRFLEGRGNRVWGARCMTSDPEWKYVNVRRFFIFLEHSIDKATQWAVFEPNNERLWKNIRQTVEDFLFVQWRDGALLGARPEDAYFVRCDRTTMSQNDLDNGRLICLVGVAPTKPAEFVIFRVGQWTADARS